MKPPALRYAAEILRDASGEWFVTFRDCPGCITSGRTFHEARRMAGDALLCWIEASASYGFRLPPATGARASEVPIMPKVYRQPRPERPRKTAERR